MSGQDAYRRQEASVCETFAADWRHADDSSDFHRSLEAAALRHVLPGSRVLEIGVGPAFVPLRLYADRGCHATGLDYLPEALIAAHARARAQSAPLDLVRGSALALPFRDESFDAVMSFGLIEHYDQTLARRMLAEHGRVSRRGGLVLVSVPSSLDLAHSLRRRWLGTRYPYYPERSLTPWRLAGEMRAVGLEPQVSDGYAPLWGLRQARFAYPITAALVKTGLLGQLEASSNPQLLSWFGGFTLQVARRL